jgi:hypothetical protein
MVVSARAEHTTDATTSSVSRRQRHLAVEKKSFFKNYNTVNIRITNDKINRVGYLKKVHIV